MSPTERMVFLPYVRLQKRYRPMPVQLVLYSGMQPHPAPYRIMRQSQSRGIRPSTFSGWLPWETIKVN